MAEYGIVAKFKDIKGNCKLSDYAGGILCLSVGFGSAATRTGAPVKEKHAIAVSVDQSSVTMVMNAGSWTAELLNALHNLTKLGDVEIAQLAQPVDKTTTAAPSVLQKLTLKNALLTSIDQTWLPIDDARLISVTLEFDAVVYEVGEKPADFVLRNITEGAK